MLILAASCWARKLILFALDLGHSNKMTSSEDLSDMVFEMKFQSKQLDKQANKVQQSSKKERDKCLSYMKQGQPDNARISAENAIRLKSEEQQV